MGATNLFVYFSREWGIYLSYSLCKLLKEVWKIQLRSGL
jgi:hypothetical protein